MLVHQSTQYAQDLRKNIHSYWLVHNSPSGYMDFDGWLKAMSYLSSICGSSPLNPQVLLCGGHIRNFDDRALNILWSHHIKSFILNSGDFVHDQLNDNGPNLKLKYLFCEARMNWMRKHITLKFTIAQINATMVETWEAFKNSSASITKYAFNNPPPPPHLTKIQNHKLALQLPKRPKDGKCRRSK